MISTLRHPEYLILLEEWCKYRFVYEGGHKFVDEYLIKFSNRETDADFKERKKISYCAASAKAAIIDIKNAIYQRMVDIVRIGGDSTYQEAIVGLYGGVDRRGSSLTGFLGNRILPELLSLGKVGVFIDKPPVPLGASKAETANLRPYMYMYACEDILYWEIEDQKLVSLCLRDVSIEDFEYKYYMRKLDLIEEGVLFQRFSDKDQLLEEHVIHIPEIPFVQFQLSQSLLVDVADHQIALTNLASSDLNYSLKSNFPFYVEQFDPASEGAYMRRTSDGKGETASQAGDQEVRTGVSHGRRYTAGLDRPGFIHPSSEPLEISMKKQEAIKTEIRQLINLAVSTLEPRRASAESKQMDNLGLEAGLSYIGLELEYGERNIGRIWSQYQGASNIPTISYPTSYSLKSDDDRIEEAKEISQFLPKLPSITFQKEVAKTVARTLIGHRISKEKLDSIYQEIDAAEFVVTDPDVIRSDHEAGFVGTQFASRVRGYPDGQVEQAKVDHAERAARIALAQSRAAARGVADMDSDPSSSGKDEKTASQSSDNSDTGARKVRGEGRSVS